INIPDRSFPVVINGPVANAGSIFILSNNNGIVVPIKDANSITTNSDILTVNDTAILSANANEYPKSNTAQAKADINPTPNSLAKRLYKLLFSIELFAND